MSQGITIGQLQVGISLLRKEGRSIKTQPAGDLEKPITSLSDIASPGSKAYELFSNKKLNMLDRIIISLTAYTFRNDNPEMRDSMVEFLGRDEVPNVAGWQYFQRQYLKYDRRYW